MLVIGVLDNGVHLTGAKLTEEELEVQKRIQKEALKEMVKTADSRVILVQADPQSPLYQLQEQALALAGRSLNTPVLGLEEIKETVQSKTDSDQKMSVSRTELGSGKGNNLTLSSVELAKASLFLLGVQSEEIIEHQGQKINLFTAFEGILRENNYYDQGKDQYQIPILDAIYIIEKPIVETFES